MTINFTNSKISSDEQILFKENKFLKSLPTILIDFFKKYSNSIPYYNSKSCAFKIIHPDGYVQVSYIEKIVELEGIFSEFEDRDTLDLYVKEQNLTTDFVEIEYLCPFAYAPNGVFYCSIGGKHEGKVYFADNGDFGILFVKNSFKEFWDSVQEG